MRGFEGIALGVVLFGLGCNQNHVKAVDLANEAEVLHQRNLNPQAIDRLKEAIQLDAECDVCHQNLAIIYQSTEAWSDAATHFKAAADLTGDAMAFANLGYVLLKDALRLAASKEPADRDKVGARLKEAEDSLSRSIQADAELYLPYYYLGQVFREQDRFEDAGKMFKSCIERNPKYPEAFNEYGKVFSELEMMDKAEAVFKEALRLNQNSGILHNQFGYILKETGRYSEAIEEFKQAAKDKDVPEAYFNLGIANYEKGGAQEKKDAEYYLDQFLKSGSRNDTMKAQARIVLNDLQQEAANNR